MRLHGFKEGKGYHVFEKDCMGQKFVVLIDEDDRSKAQREPLLPSRKERLNSVLSDYESSSELTDFPKSSRTGEKFMLSQDLFEVLSHSQEFGERNGRLFWRYDRTALQAMADCPFPRKKAARRQIGRRLEQNRLSKSEPFGKTIARGP